MIRGKLVADITDTLQASVLVLHQDQNQDYQVYGKDRQTSSRSAERNNPNYDLVNAVVRWDLGWGSLLNSFKRLPTERGCEMRTAEKSPAASQPVIAASTRLISAKIQPTHLERLAIVYVRQSTQKQVLENRESTARQYALADRAVALGWPAAAVEVIDECLGKVVDAALGKKAKVIITADHGNIEQLIDYDTGMPHTAHTTNPVPVILVDDEGKNSHLNQGTGIDIAPTLLQLLQQPQPQEMTGRSLILGS